MTAELVGPLPTITFQDDTRVAYTPPRNTVDPRARACTNHRPACDCREAEHAENLAEHRSEWAVQHAAAAQALAGHQVQVPIGVEGNARRSFPLCLCSGCVIHRVSRGLLSHRDIDYKTGRVKPAADRQQVKYG